MKTTAIIAGCILLYLLLAPPAYTYTVTKHFNRLINNPAQLCFDIHSNTLRDPSSAYITADTTYPTRVTVKFRALNGLGMMLPGSFTCPLIDGRFVEDVAIREKLSIK